MEQLDALRSPLAAHCEPGVSLLFGSEWKWNNPKERVIAAVIAVDDDDHWQGRQLRIHQERKRVRDHVTLVFWHTTHHDPEILNGEHGKNRRGIVTKVNLVVVKRPVTHRFFSSFAV
jgi:hypothetical protein